MGHRRNCLSEAQVVELVVITQLTLTLSILLLITLVVLFRRVAQYTLDLHLIPADDRYYRTGLSVAKWNAAADCANI